MRGGGGVGKNSLILALTVVRLYFVESVYNLNLLFTLNSWDDSFPRLSLIAMLLA